MDCSETLICKWTAVKLLFVEGQIIYVTEIHAMEVR